MKEHPAIAQCVGSILRGQESRIWGGPIHNETPQDIVIKHYCYLWDHWEMDKLMLKALETNNRAFLKARLKTCVFFRKVWRVCFLEVSMFFHVFCSFEVSAKGTSFPSILSHAFSSGGNITTFMAGRCTATTGVGECGCPWSLCFGRVDF